MATPEALTHAMATRSRKKLILAATLAGGIQTYLSAKNRIKMEDGGPLITNPLIVGSNPNVGTARYYDTVPVDETNELTTVLYQMTRLVGTLIMSDQEGDENQGDAVIVKILTAKIEALDMQLRKSSVLLLRHLIPAQTPLGFLIFSLLILLVVLSEILIWPTSPSFAPLLIILLAGSIRETSKRL
jgi:hypothetical protein